MHGICTIRIDGEPMETLDLSLDPGFPRMVWNATNLLVGLHNITVIALDSGQRNGTSVTLDRFV